METIIVPVLEGVKDIGVLEKRVALRTMSADDWINTHASGTLRKNKKLGMAWKAHYLIERICYEFGWEFEVQPQSRVLEGIAFTEGDESAVTEAGWHIERYIEMNVFPEDKFSCKYLNIEYADGEKKEGIGIIVEQTSAPFIPSGNTVFAIVAEFNPKKGEWKMANNPF